jgi:hypothetical protein
VTIGNLQAINNNNNNNNRVTKSRMRWARHVARLGEIRNAYNILVGKTEGNRPLGRAMSR